MHNIRFSANAILFLPASAAYATQFYPTAKPNSFMICISAWLPLLKFVTAVFTAISTIFLAEFVVLGQNVQINAFSDSFAFYVFPPTQRLSKFGCDISLNTGFIASITATYTELECLKFSLVPFIKDFLYEYQESFSSGPKSCSILSSVDRLWYHIAQVAFCIRR